MMSLRKRKSHSPMTGLNGDESVMSEASTEKERILGFSDDEEDGVSVPTKNASSVMMKTDHVVPPDLASDLISESTVPSQFSTEAEEVEGDIDFFNKAVHITNVDKIDHAKLLRKMHERFKKKVMKWEARAYTYSRYNFAMNFTILVLQLFQMILHQAANIWIVADKEMMTIHSLLTAVTALIAGLQLKLKLSQKSERYRRGAKVYGRLLRTSTYYIMLVESGGKIDDVTGLWREAMKKEGKWVPLVRTYMPM